MKKQILALEKIASRLDPAPLQREKVRKKVIAYTEDFLQKIEKLKAFQVTTEKGIGLLDALISEEPRSIEHTMSLIRDQVDLPGLNPASGGHLAYIPGGGIYYASLGDYLAAITNRFAGVFFASPGAVRMENMLLRWMAKILGYPKTAVGNLTSGGSVANLIAIVTARDAKGVRARSVEKSVIYLSLQVHHSVEKAIRIAGLEDAILRYVPLDDRYRMIPVELEKQIKEDKKKRRRPFLVIATAGTTDVGAVDPLIEIGEIAHRHNLWYHIDAAYGGFFVLTREGKRRLRGIETSDSVVIDPHKGLFLPYGLGAVLVKDRTQLMKSHHYSAHYMQDALADEEEPSPAELSPELTKHFRGMRLWLPLQLHGVAPFRACLQEKLLLAKYFYREVRKLGFETGPPPELSVVTYRYVTKQGDPNEFNKRLWELVMEDGRVFISSTTINGRFILRFACLAFRTHLRTVDLLLRILKEKTTLLERSFGSGY